MNEETQHLAFLVSILKTYLECNELRNINKNMETVKLLDNLITEVIKQVPN